MPLTQDEIIDGYYRDAMKLSNEELARHASAIDRYDFSDMYSFASVCRQVSGARKVWKALCEDAQKQAEEGEEL